MGGEDPLEGRSGHEIPEEYGETRPYYMKALCICVPAAAIAALMVYGPSLEGTAELENIRLQRLVVACRAVLCQVAAAYAFGSNVWLFCYGKKMFKVCSTHSQWLGKEAFSTIQAACFPDFFALQTAAALLVYGGYVGGAREVDARLQCCAGLAVFLGLCNLLWLGPKSIPLMMDLYRTPAEAVGKEDALLPLKQAKKRFGMVHGMSMLLDIFALGAMGVFIAGKAVLEAQ
eukprot:TRINITY_DN70117_c0_g1_i1.p1 TRINITY_DN70117_c0_g1~~TRINITY_DN70117_c0_g1_i1.p1  ORF type:complete len:231 (+),score=49.71 TRINITY_DN70117_c0_g1_i1:75-767(+)